MAGPKQRDTVCENTLDPMSHLILSPYHTLNFGLYTHWRWVSECPAAICHVTARGRLDSQTTGRRASVPVTRISDETRGQICDVTDRGTHPWYRTLNWNDYRHKLNGFPVMVASRNKRPTRQLQIKEQQNLCYGLRQNDLASVTEFNQSFFFFFSDLKYLSQW